MSVSMLKMSVFIVSRVKVESKKNRHFSLRKFRQQWRVVEKYAKYK